jgi:YVTN family beta-propeller protein
MRAVADPKNLYSATATDRLSPAVAGTPTRVYVPNRRSNSVYVIDPATHTVVDRWPVGFSPQHVVPSWDLKTLWVANNGSRRKSGSLTPIDPKTGKVGPAIPIDDPYNLYFTPDGRSAIVVAERHKRLDFRDPQTMALQQSVAAPGCSGINHADFSIDGRYAIFTCEFRGGGLVKIDLVNRQVLGYLRLTKRGMPQDIRISPDGSVFYVADMHADGVYLVDGDGFIQTDFIPTGVGTHGLYPSRDATKLCGQPRLTRRARPGAGAAFRSSISRPARSEDWPSPAAAAVGNVTADGSGTAVGSVRQCSLRHDTATGEVRASQSAWSPGSRCGRSPAIFARPHREYALTLLARRSFAVRR